MRRALAAALAAVALPAAAGCGVPGAAHSAGPSAPASVITRQQAQQVLSQYTRDANRSNQVRDAGFLATFETAPSLQLDQGYYRWTTVTDPSNHAYSPVAFDNPVFYVPQQPHYPAWFAVRAWQQFQKKTKPAAGTAPRNTYAYLVFTRASSTAKWKLSLEPVALKASGTLAQVATDRYGFAQVVPAAGTKDLAPPGKLPSMNVKDLNYNLDPQDASTSGQTPEDKMRAAQQQKMGKPVKAKGPKPVAFVNGQQNLSDVHDLKFWRSRMPQGSSQTDLHATTTDPVYALRTTDGGALVLYDLTADLSLGVPYGGMMGLMAIRVPGFLNGKEKPQASFDIRYGDQFAVQEPPGKTAHPTVVADASDPVSAECGGGPCGQ